MEFKIKHDIPGRLRLHFKTTKNANISPGDIGAHLQQSGIGCKSDYRSRSGSLILTYKPTKKLRKQLLELLRALKSDQINTNKLEMVLHADSCDSSCDRCRSDQLNPPSLLHQIVTVTALTGYVLWVFVRQVIFKKTIAENPLSLTSAVSLIGAIPLFAQAWRDLRAGQHKSLFPFLAFTCFLAISLGQALTALEVIWILRVGMLLEDYVARRSRRAIKEILELTEKNAFILVDGIEVEIAVDQIETGSTIVCHAGEKIPVDGIVIRGEALVDESPITGRAEMETRQVENRVFAGTIVSQGVLFIRADKVGDDTYLCRILHMVETSLSNRAPAEKHADVLANRLMNIGAIAVAGTFILTLSPIRAFTVLLVLACPCATVLAASTAVSAALANAARNHILIKGGYYLEQMSEANCFCFDKTGTLTVETPELIEITPRTPRQKEDSILILAAAAELHTPHPMARAVVTAAKQRNLDIPHHDHCEFVIGRGVRATIAKADVVVGNDKWMAENSIDIRFFSRKAEHHLEQGHTLIYVARDGKAQGLIAVANPIRPETAPVLNWLRDSGVTDLHMITGDTQRMAQSIGEQFGFQEWRAELLPEEKAAYLKELEKSKNKVVMVGDGVNDAIALAEAKVGIAMGAGGAEVAIEAADIALADSNLERLVYLRQLSTKTLSTIELNHQLAMWTNIGGVILGAAGIMTPVMAGTLHIVHTLGIILNSSRLLSWEAPGLPKETNEVVLK